MFALDKGRFKVVEGRLRYPFGKWFWIILVYCIAVQDHSDISTSLTILCRFFFTMGIEILFNAIWGISIVYALEPTFSPDTFFGWALVLGSGSSLILLVENANSLFFLLGSFAAFAKSQQIPVFWVVPHVSQFGFCVLTKFVSPFFTLVS